jgi:hypothetical protein
MCRTLQIFEDSKERIAYRRCEHAEEQVKKAVTGFNEMVRVCRWQLETAMEPGIE